MDRRTFLEAAALPLAATTLHSVMPMSPSPFVRAARHSSLVVVGSGAFGAWTALRLRELGHEVTLLDAYGPGNARASSGDDTRQLRCGYGDREAYAAMALRALSAWRSREAEFGTELFLETGRLQLSPAWTAEMRATQAVLARLGVACEALTQDDLRRRYPSMRIDDVGAGLLEPGAGVLRARPAILAATRAFQQKGGRLLVQHARPGRAEGRRLLDVACGDGTRIAAERFVFACGPWLPKVFPALLGTRIRVPQREVFHFGLPAGDTRFVHPNFPNFSEDGYYGFASIDGRGFKVCPTTGAAPFDPDTDERVVSALEVRRARAYLARRFPSIASEPITETRVCQLENTADEHFIIDAHPDHDNVLIAGGGSGHAFKHGPVLGEYVARRALGEAVDPAFDAMVRLAR